MSNLVSICIPAYEMHGRGIPKLSTLLNSIRKQTFKDYEVILSDHSKDESIKNLIREYDDINIKYFKYEEKYGNGPANTNNAINHATCKYIKPMFQDDYFFENESLQKMVDILERSEKKWLVVSIKHCNNNDHNIHRPYNALWPEYSEYNIENYMKQKPNIGSPSMVMFENNPELRFDENLVNYMDVEMWYHIGKLYSAPEVSREYLVIVRVWDYTISSTTGRSSPADKEIGHIINKYK